MSNGMFAPIGGPAPKREKSPDLIPVLPVPAAAPPLPARPPGKGVFAGMWPYHDAAGDVLFYICRINLPGGEKRYSPIALFRSSPDGPAQWHFKGIPEPRPVYGLDRLAARPTAPVVVCEGEKSAEAATLLLPGHVAITSPNGSKSAAKADWAPVKDRDVIVWPDADAAGAAYADDVCRLAVEAGARSIRRITPPSEAEGIPGWDAADALAGAWTQERATALVAGAKAVSVPAPAPKAPRPSEAGDKGEKRHRAPPQRDSLMSLTEGCDLWHGSDGECFATYPVGSHRESWPIRSRQFKRWLANEAYEHLGLVPGGQAVQDLLGILEARASMGAERDPWLRTGFRNGRQYIDLCDRDWRALEISSRPLTPEGACWRILTAHDLPFVRSGAMLPLPAPVTDDACSISELAAFVNTETEDDFTLAVSWLLAALRNRGPYPVLILNGQQGTGKSTCSKYLRSLVDPNAAPIRAAPRDDRDLIVAAVNAHCLVIDNMSSMPVWLADGLCRLATGGGFSARALHTDRDEMTFMATRPILLNGIPSLADRADLADRAVTVRLRPIAEDERRPEEEMDAAWEAARPRILAALCDALSTALRRLPETKLKKLPRQADFAKWVAAAETGLGWEVGTFESAYWANRRDVMDTAFEASPLGMALLAFAQDRKLWQGTATELLPKLNDMVDIQTRGLKLWPQTAQSLGNTIERIAPLLKGKGVVVDKKHSGTRTITVALAGA